MKTINRLYIVAFLTLGFTACSEKTPKEDGPVQVDFTKTQTVEVVHPQQRSFTAESLISGTAMADQKVTVYAMERGYVQRLSKDIGDRVRKDEVIATLANPEIQRLLEELNAEMGGKRSTYERLKIAYASSPALTPKQLVEEAQADYLTTWAKVRAVQDRVNFLSVKAPFSGQITKRYIDQGALVQSGLTEDNPQAIFEIQAFNPIRLTIPVPESDIASVQKGMDVSVNFPELAGETIEAKVSRTSGALDAASKTMQVEIDLNNAKGAIRPGMYAKVNMQLSSRQGVISLPVTAQWLSQNQAFVFVVKDGVVRRIALHKGLSNKDYFEVLNPEITEESLVITQGKGLVKDGQTVKSILKAE